jgi:endonuclease/exonuclease/phosphatase family metal-dependent hydrolase
MTVRLASFNVENLFARPRALNQQTWEQGEAILEAFAELSKLLERVVYMPADKARMIELLIRLDIYRVRDGVVRRNRTPTPRWGWLRANRGTFDVEREDSGIEIVADSRAAWTGWVELATEPVDEINTRMTAQVIHDVAADVLGVIEAENRPSLDRFNQDLLGGQYGHVMLIDGNDSRGIDVGIMTTSAVEIVSMRSNVDVPDPGAAGEHLFSRDCVEYECRVPGGSTVRVLINHFKSQSGGGGSKRRRQAEGVRKIVDRLVADGQQNMVVIGDLNEGPEAVGQTAVNLAPLYGSNSPLVDVYSLPVFDLGPKKVPGTFQSCGIRDRLDYVFVSRALAPLVTAGGIERHGLWGTPTNVNPPSQWEIYPDITRSEHAASDHGAIWVDLNM